MSIATSGLAGLLRDLGQAGIAIRLDGTEVVCKGPRNVLAGELGQRLKQHKAELLAHLENDPWTTALAAAEAAIDQAQWDPRLADVQRRVLGHYRTVARKHHDNRDPALFGWAEEVKYEMQTIWGLRPVPTEPTPTETAP